MTLPIRLTALALLAGLLAACAYKPLKAPCSAGDDTALAYAEPSKPRVSEAFTSLDGCGPMRPI